MLWRGIVLVMCALALTACSAEDAPSTSQTLEPSPSPAPRVAVQGCPTAEDAIADPDNLRGGVVDGPIASGGAWGSVRIVIDDEAEQGCRALLVASSNDGDTAIALGTTELPVDPDVVRLGGLAAIDDRAGAEVIVHELTGASTGFVAVYSLGSGELERVSVEAGPYGDLFPTGGSVGHLEASDCLGPQGEVVISLAEPRGAGYQVTRSFFSAERGTFVPSGNEQVRIRDAQDIEQFQEFIGSPFGTCERS